jgi:hypothetical protein
MRVEALWNEKLCEVSELHERRRALVTRHGQLDHHLIFEGDNGSEL